MRKKYIEQNYQQTLNEIRLSKLFYLYFKGAQTSNCFGCIVIFMMVQPDAVIIIKFFHFKSTNYSFNTAINHKINNLTYN